MKTTTLTVREVKGMLTRTQWADCTRVSLQWARWLQDPAHNPRPTRETKAHQTTTRQRQQRFVAKATMTPIDIDRNMRQLAQEAKQKLGPQARAEMELRRLRMADRLDPDPGSHTAGHFAWASRQSQRDAEKRRWRLELPD